VQKRFYGGQSDDNVAVLFGYVYCEALVEAGLHFVVQFAGDGHVDAFALVDIFSFEVPFL